MLPVSGHGQVDRVQDANPDLCCLSRNGTSSQAALGNLPSGWKKPEPPASRILNIPHLRPGPLAACGDSGILSQPGYPTVMRPPPLRSFNTLKHLGLVTMDQPTGSADPGVRGSKHENTWAGRPTLRGCWSPCHRPGNASGKGPQSHITRVLRDRPTELRSSPAWEGAGAPPLASEVTHLHSVARHEACCLLSI